MTRLIYFGMGGQFSLTPLKRLLEAGAQVCAVVTPADRAETGPFPRRLQPPMPAPSALPMAGAYLEQSIIHLAWNRQIPVWEVASLSGAETLTLLASFQPELISVVCFPYIFPSALLELPRYGCLNLHPSLLPAYRGPAPLFWIARQDERTTGVTLHFLDQGIDSGDIVAQSRFHRPDGLSGTALERRCAEAGAALLVEALDQLDHSGRFPGRPQPKAGACYFSWPTETDCVIPTHWPARRAFNFIRGAESWPLTIALGETKLPVQSALSYSAEQILAEPYRIFGNDTWIQFQPGVLRAKIYGSSPEQGRGK